MNNYNTILTCLDCLLLTCCVSHINRQLSQSYQLTDYCFIKAEELQAKQQVSKKPWKASEIYSDDDEDDEDDNKEDDKGRDRGRQSDVYSSASESGSRSGSESSASDDE